MSYYLSSSTYKKGQQLSSGYQIKKQNYISRQQVSTATRNTTLQKQTSIHQQQITDLQRKIDLILMHNQKLESQKQRYRLMLQEMRFENNQRTLKSNTARFLEEENQTVIEKLRQELELTVDSYERRLNQAFESRKILKEQIETLSKIVESLNQQNRDFKLVIKEQSLKVQSLTFKLKQQFIRQHAQLQNKLRDQFLIRQIQLKNQKKQAMDIYQNQIEEVNKVFISEKEQIRRSNLDQANKMMEDFQEQRKEIAREGKQRFEEEILLIQQAHREEVKKEQQRASEYIKKNIQNVQSNDEQMKGQYQYEIGRLRQSLQSRRRLIDQLLAENSFPKDAESHIQQSECQQISEQQHLHSVNLSIQIRSPTQISWFPELLSLKEQLRQVTSQYLQQSQLLKLKLTEKFQVDIKELRNIYEDKIQLMALHTERAHGENNRLRDIYEKTLQAQIQAKKDHQLQKGKLKNLVRKLKVQFHGIQDQFRINVEGVHDQNNTFSMTMMRSMIQVKQKANFYSQQNRKLRMAYQQHQLQTVQSLKQSQQKVNYYQSKYESLKERLNTLVGQYKQKIQLTQLQAEQRENSLRENLNKQHQIIHQIIGGLRTDVQGLKMENQNLRSKCHEIQVTFKQKDQDIAYYRTKVDQLEADIQRLKLDLEMKGVDDKDKTDTINQWRSHYQTIVAQLQDEKAIINQKLIQRDQQLAQLVKRYKIIEEELAKVVGTLKKRSNIQKKVLQIGMDTNLVKNLAQLFAKDNQSKSQFKEKETLQE